MAIPTPEEVAAAIDLDNCFEWTDGISRERLRQRIERVIAADRERRAPGDGPAAVPVEAINQALCAIVGRLDLLIDGLSESDATSVSFREANIARCALKDATAAREAAQALADLCRRAESQGGGA